MRSIDMKRRITACGSTVDIDTSFEMFEIESFTGEEGPLGRWVETRLGVGVPRPGQVVTLDSTQIMRTGPRHLLVAGHLCTKESNGYGVAVTSIGDGLARLCCRGSGLRQWLASFTPLDLRAGAFGAGSAAWTAFLDVRVLLHCIGDDSFDLYCPASYCEDILECLAGGPDGR